MLPTDSDKHQLRSGYAIDLLESARIFLVPIPQFSGSVINVENKTIVLVLLGAVVGVTGFSDASAETPTEEISSFSEGPIVRDGLFAGVSFGRGSIEVSCGTCSSGGGTLSEGLSVEGHAGFMLTPQIGVVGEHWSVRYNQRGGAIFNDSTPHLVAQHISTIGAQVFLGHGFWFRTGVGVGKHITDGDYAKKKNPSGTVFFAGGAAGEVDSASPDTQESLSSFSPAYYAAAGWEFAHTESLAAEIQFRIASTERPKDEYQIRNVGFNVGLSWY